MVGFDSIIPPGREGTITSRVSLKNLHGGKISKSVRVTSNAENDPSLSLTITGEIMPILGVSSRYVRLKNNASEPQKLVLTTRKKDLEVKEVVLKPREKKKAGWQSALPFYLEYKLMKDDSANAKGYYDHELHLWSKLAVEETKHGTLVIVSNHPEKKELEVRGRVDAQ